MLELQLLSNYTLLVLNLAKKLTTHGKLDPFITPKVFSKWRHDIQRIDTQHNDIQHEK